MKPVGLTGKSTTWRSMSYCRIPCDRLVLLTLPIIRADSYSALSSSVPPGNTCTPGLANVSGSTLASNYFQYFDSGALDMAEQ
jgi:hypothetical protein